MNRFMCFVILFSLLLLSCGNSNSKTSNDNTLNTGVKQVKKDFAKGDFVADTTINKKLFLENCQSVEAYFKNSNCIDLVEQIRSSPVAVFSNNGKNEYLLAYQYEGGVKNSFSCFEIGKLSDLQNMANSSVKQINIASFSTESNLQLGQSIEDVKRIKGDSFIATTEDDEKIITYKIEDPKSDFLIRYSMPSYFLQITFDQTEKVKRIVFDYP